MTVRPVLMIINPQPVAVLYVDKTIDEIPTVEH